MECLLVSAQGDCHQRNKTKGIVKFIWLKKKYIVEIRLTLEFYLVSKILGQTRMPLTYSKFDRMHRTILHFYTIPLQFMEKEEAMNILQFWLAADNFQNQLAAKKGQYDGQEAQNDAMILYDK